MYPSFTCKKKNNNKMSDWKKKKKNLFLSKCCFEKLFKYWNISLKKMEILIGEEEMGGHDRDSKEERERG